MSYAVSRMKEDPKYLTLEEIFRDRPEGVPVLIVEDDPLSPQTGIEGWILKQDKEYHFDYSIIAVPPRAIHTGDAHKMCAGIRYLVVDEFLPASFQSGCSCSTPTLMQAGCVCGHIKRYSYE